MAHATADTRQAHRNWWLSWMDTLAARERRRRALRDISGLPDYLKLDIGYYDDDRRGPAR